MAREMFLIVREMFLIVTPCSEFCSNCGTIQKPHHSCLSLMGILTAICYGPSEGSLHHCLRNLNQIPRCIFPIRRILHHVHSIRTETEFHVQNHILPKGPTIHLIHCVLVRSADWDRRSACLFALLRFHIYREPWIWEL